MYEKNVTTNGTDRRDARAVRSFFLNAHHVNSVKKEEHVIMVFEQAFDKIRHS